MNKEIEAYTSAVQETLDPFIEDDELFEHTQQAILTATATFLRGLVGPSESLLDPELITWNDPRDTVPYGREQLREELRQAADQLNRVEGDSK